MRKPIALRSFTELKAITPYLSYYKLHGYTVKSIKTILLNHFRNKLQIRNSHFWSGEFEGMGSVRGIKSCKIVFPGGTSYSIVQTLLLKEVSFSHNTLRHRQAD